MRETTERVGGRGQTDVEKNATQGSLQKHDGPMYGMPGSRTAQVSAEFERYKKKANAK